MHNANFAQWLWEAQGTTDFFSGQDFCFGLNLYSLLVNLHVCFFLWFTSLFLLVHIHIWVVVGDILFVFVRGDSCLPKL
jgi:hypothetical protein